MSSKTIYKTDNIKINIITLEPGTTLTTTPAHPCTWHIAQGADATFSSLTSMGIKAGSVLTLIKEKQASIKNTCNETDLIIIETTTCCS